MRIGIMLRHYEQHGGGVRVYTRALLKHLFAQPGEHENALFFNNPSLLGTYAAVPQVTEVSVPGKSVLWWDQVSLPRELRRHGVNVLFNPKYSVPLDGPLPVRLGLSRTRLVRDAVGVPLRRPVEPPPPRASLCGALVRDRGRVGDHQRALDGIPPSPGRTESPPFTPVSVTSSGCASRAIG